MSRYTGPKARINRRLGALVFESAGAAKAYGRRDTPPGQQQPRRKISKYGEAMREKQKIKYYYGLHERQLRRMFDKATKAKGNTGENLLLLCERRLDSAVRLSGLTKTRPQARQGIAHGHFQLNGRRNDIPSTQVRPGDVIDIRARGNIEQLYLACLAESDGTSADWVALDRETLRITIQRLPTVDDITLPVDIGMVVELLSR